MLLATSLGLLTGTSMAASQGFIVKLDATPDSAVQARKLAGGNALLKAQARPLGNHWYLLSTTRTLPASLASALAAQLRNAQHVQHAFQSLGRQVQCAVTRVHTILRWPSGPV